LEIIGAYAPAKEQEKGNSLKHLTDYARSTGTQAEQSEDCHMIIAGDWNRYLQTRK
jgi:exonuclease III